MKLYFRLEAPPNEQVIESSSEIYVQGRPPDPETLVTTLEKVAEEKVR